MMGVRELSKNYAKGLDYYDQGLLVDALAAFEAVAKESGDESPEARLARFYIGETHARLAAESISRGSTERAVQHLREAISRNPKFPDLHCLLAEVLASSGALHDAMVELETAIQMNAGYAKAIMMLGTLAYEIGEREAGLKHVAQAVELEPRYDLDIYHDALASHGRGDFRRALAMLREMLVTNVDDISFHFTLGKKLYRSGEYREAVEAFEQALSLKNNYPDIRNWLGLALMAKGDHEEAFEQFQEALEINPNYVGAMINAGIACELIGIPEDAAAFYRRALETDPDNLEAKERLGTL
ncbi:MAG: tetratricopeptide repeat protein [Armatimonadetes bacterium]|nr:tetratricopeptide repeat protein [Armatimonadota bacterium]